MATIKFIMSIARTRVRSAFNSLTNVLSGPGVGIFGGILVWYDVVYNFCVYTWYAYIRVGLDFNVPYETIAFYTLKHTFIFWLAAFISMGTITILLAAAPAVVADYFRFHNELRQHYFWSRVTTTIVLTTMLPFVVIHTVVDSVYLRIKYGSNKSKIV